MNDSVSEQEEPAVADAPMADDDKAAASLDITAVADAPLAVEAQGEDMALNVSLSPAQAEKVECTDVMIAGLQSALDGLRTLGEFNASTHLEYELRKAKRFRRMLITQNPAVAEAFLQRRRADEAHTQAQQRLVAKMNEQSRLAAEAKADRDAALEELKRHKKSMLEMEGIRECKHALKQFTLPDLGEGSINAGGAKARDRRFEVLDRLRRMRAGLSPAQKNDWEWFKKTWDQEMVNQHGKNWAALFARWMQEVLDDNRSNAFSLFVHNETNRVFHGIVALQVPGA